MSLANAFGERAIQRDLAENVASYISNEALELELLSFEALRAQYCRVSVATDAVATLRDKFFATHGGEITPIQAALYEHSVESIIHASGIEPDREELFVSFESALCYSTEAENKVTSTLQKLGKWLMDLLSKIASGVMGLVEKFRGSVSQRKAKLVALRDRLRNKKGGKADAADAKDQKADDKAEPSTEAKDGSGVQVPDIKILGGTGATIETTINKAHEGARKAARDMLDIVKKVSNAARGYDPVKHKGTEGLDEFMKTITDAAGMEKTDEGAERKFDIVNGTGTQIVFKRKSDATVTAVTSRIPYEKKPGHIPGMSVDQVLKTVEFLIESYDKIKEIEGPMTTASGIFKQMAGVVKTSYDRSIAAVRNAANDEDADKAASVSRVYSTLGHVLQSLAGLPTGIIASYMDVHTAADYYVAHAAQ